MPQTAKDLLHGVDAERLRHDLFYLCREPLPFRKVTFTRPGQGQSSLADTDDFLDAELSRVGYRVSRHPYQVRPFRCDSSKPIHHWYAPPHEDDPWFTACNVEVERSGQERPKEVIVLVSHKDSMSWIDSPGAHDNASGTAANLEIARALAAWPLRRSVRFLFCNEEHTPWTSRFAAEAYAARGEKITAVLNQDSLAGKSDAERARGALTHVVAYSTPEGRDLAELIRRVHETHRIGLQLGLTFKERVNDDDGMFIKAGFPRTVMNVGSFPYADSQYHLPGDIPERVDLENLRRSTALVLATVLALDAE